MVEKYDLDQEDASKEDVMEEFGVVVNRTTSGDKEEVLKEFGVVINRTPSGDVAPQSYSDWKKQEAAKKQTPPIFFVLGGLIGLVVLALLAVMVYRYATTTANSGIAIPSVVGQSAVAAKDAITAAGFRAVESDVKSDKPAGTVLSTTPAAGTQRKAGSDVTVVVSKP